MRVYQSQEYLVEYVGVEMGRGQDAHKILRPVLVRFENFIIHKYNTIISHFGIYEAYRRSWCCLNGRKFEISAIHINSCVQLFFNKILQYRVQL